MAIPPFSSAGYLILRNFSWVLFGYFVYNICQWLNFVIIAKLISVEAVGQFTLALAIAGPIVIFTNLGLRQALATDGTEKYPLAQYISLRGLGSALAFVAILLVTMALDYDSDTTLVIAILAAAKVVEAQSDLFYGLFQRCERLDHIARSLLIRGPLALAALSLGIYASHELSLGVAGVLLLWLLTLLFYDIPSGLRLARSGERASGSASKHDRSDFGHTPSFPGNLGGLPALAWEVLPLGFVGIFSALQMAIPRYVVAEELGLRELGYFGAILYIVLAGNHVVQALGQSALSRLSHRYSSGEKRPFVRLLVSLTLAGLAIGALGLAIAVVGGEQLLMVLYTGDYGAYGDVFVILMAAGTIRYGATILNYGAAAARRFRSQMLNHGVATAVAAVACLMLVQPYGLRGAALAILASAVSYLLGALIMVAMAVSRIGDR
jgi:O-antigen/teichoic acid export membrane protein